MEASFCSLNLCCRELFASGGCDNRVLAWKANLTVPGTRSPFCISMRHQVALSTCRKEERAPWCRHERVHRVSCRPESDVECFFGKLTHATHAGARPPPEHALARSTRARASTPAPSPVRAARPSGLPPLHVRSGCRCINVFLTLCSMQTQPGRGQQLRRPAQLQMRRPLVQVAFYFSE